MICIRPSWYVALLIIMCWPMVPIAAILSEELIANIKRSVVRIDTIVEESPYQEGGRNVGTGALIDRERGIIVTNHHVVHEGMAQYTVTFSNGRQLEALLLYTDPWVDLALLKIDVSRIPENTPAMTIDVTELDLDQSVAILGMNEGVNFALQTGRVSSVYDAITPLAFHAIRVSLNVQGGASGSPLIDERGVMRGVIFSTNEETFAYAVAAPYIQRLLDKVVEGRPIERYHMGMLLHYYSLDDAVRYHQFPEEAMIRYGAQYPKAMNRVLRVSRLLKGSPADQYLKPGDIIWAVGDEPIGPMLHRLDELLDQTHGRPILMTVIREGQFLAITVPVYDLVPYNQLRRFIMFGGAKFFETNDQLRMITDIAPGSIMFALTERGKNFADEVPPMPGSSMGFYHLTQLQKHPIRRFEDLIMAIREVVNQPYIYVTLRNMGVYRGYNEGLILSRQEQQIDIQYPPTSPEPLLYEWQEDVHRWKMTPLVTRVSEHVSPSS